MKKIKVDNFFNILFLDILILSIIELVVRINYFRPLLHTFKFFNILEFFVATIYFLQKSNKKYNIVQILFFIFFFQGIIVGLFNKNSPLSFIIQSYQYIMPIIMLEYSKNIVNKLQYNNLKIRKKVKILGIVYVICVLIFKCLYMLGMTNYSAYGSGTIMYILPYLLFFERDKKISFLVILAGILSGKRVILLEVLIICSLYLILNFKKIKLKYFLIGVPTFVSGFIYLYKCTNVFNRILFTFNNLFSDSKNYYLATGGRSEEIFLIIKKLNSNFISWFIGKGFGYKVQIAENLFRGYSHFSPLGYTMIVGIFFPIILYTIFIYIFWKLFLNKKKICKMFSVYIMEILFASLTGGVLFNETKVWFIIGLSYCLYKSRYHLVNIN